MTSPTTPILFTTDSDISREEVVGGNYYSITVSGMSEPVVTVQQGVIRGLEVDGATGGSYLSFKGIPYAAPPIGDLRFRDPQPVQPWTGIRDAVAEGPKCAQPDILTQEIIGDDDCLYLNIATKSLTGSRPVMVWIHGGGFFFGDGSFDMYGPDYMIGSDIVYVGINYRLGVLGFLHLDHEVVPGNMGLKDQVAALKWVKENISQFGGDPNNVTIFGESAGGAAVHYLLISPLARGLFHKAIMQSGVAFNPFASTPKAADMAHRFVAALGKDVTDPNDIVEYLRTIPAHRLVAVQQSLQTPEEYLNFNFPFGPGVDDKSFEPFMPKPFQQLAAEGFEVPVIIGYNRHEGNIMLRTRSSHGVELPEQTFTSLEENFEVAVPRDLVAKAPSKVSEIARELRKLYFGDKKITRDLFDEYVRFYEDLQFVVGINRVIEIQRGKKSPTYFYRFSFDSPHSIYKTLFQVQGKGATHMDEVQYLFFATKARELIVMKPGSTEEVMRDRLVRMWTDFAKTGNPTPVINDLVTEKWEPVTKTGENYLEIDAELSAGLSPNKEMWETWKRVYAIAEY